jgi:hypothetical protein
VQDNTLLGYTHVYICVQKDDHINPILWLETFSDQT